MICTGPEESDGMTTAFEGILKHIKRYDFFMTKTCYAITMLMA